MKPKHENRYKNAFIIVGSLWMLSILLFWSVGKHAVAVESQSETDGLETGLNPDNTVTFFQTVSPDTFGTGGSGMIGTRQVVLNEINEAIMPSGGYVLIVTSITGYHPAPKADSSFSAVSLLGLTETGSSRGYGDGGLSVSGTKTTQVNFEPGLVVQLTQGGSLSIRSFTQSDDTVRVGVHGYLMEYPLK